MNAPLLEESFLYKDIFEVNKTYYYASFILLQSVIYGLGNPLTKLAYESITPFWLLAARYVFAVPLILFLARKTLKEDLRHTSVKVWLPPCIFAACAYISGNVALDFTTATNLGFIMSLPVLIAPVLAVPVLNRKYSWRHLPIQLICVFGLFLLCCNGGAFHFNAGDLLALLFAFFLAGHLVFGERVLQEMHVTSATALQLCFAMILCTSFAFIFDDPAVLKSVQPQAWMVVLYLGIICSIGGFLLQNTAVPKLSSQTVALLQCTQPILTAVFSFFLLGETLSPIALLGAAIIIACLVVDSRIQDEQGPA